MARPWVLRGGNGRSKPWRGPVRKPRDECDGVREELAKLPPPSCEPGPGARCQCFGHGLKVEQSAQLAPRLVEEGSSHGFIELVAIPSSMSSSSRERSICCLGLWVANMSSPPGKDHAGSLAASSIACVSSVVVLPPKKKKETGTPTRVTTEPSLPPVPPCQNQSDPHPFPTPL